MSELCPVYVRALFGVGAVVVRVTKCDPLRRTPGRVRMEYDQDRLDEMVLGCSP